MGKEKPPEKPPEKPAEKPAEKSAAPPEEKKEVVNPATGEREVVECLASVLRKLDALTEKVAEQGKALLERVTGTTEKLESTSAPEEKAKPEPLDPWSN